MKNYNDALNLIKSEVLFWSRLGFGQNPPVLNEYGEETLAEPPEKNITFCKQMYDAGIRVFTSIIPCGWVGIDKYDFRMTDKTLDIFFKECPNAFYMPRIKITPPIEWQKANPEELYIYEWANLKNNNEISDCAGSLMQDPVGTMKGKSCQMGHQSFSSEKWKNDALVALKKIIEHMEMSKYADRIIAYHIGYGKCGETHFWGDSADFGKTNRKKFYEFGLRKYKTYDNLKRAWNVTELTPEATPVPTNDERYCTSERLESFFHINNALYIDYNEFRKEISADLIRTFSKTVKEISGKPVGFFHGYIMHAGADYHGHTDLEDVLCCEYVDFLSAPKSYYRSEYGQPGGSYSPVMSVNRRKLWVEEVDVRTHKETSGNYGATKSFEETRWVLWREFAKNEMSGSSYWYMDLGGGWYDDENILNEIKQIIKTKNELNKKPHKSISDILVVVDELTALQTTQNKNFYIRTLQDTTYELATIGAPYNLYKQSDLVEIDLSAYKLVIFLNAFSLDYKQFSKLNFSDNTYFVWNYAPGYISGDTQKLCGMSVAQTGSNDEFPYLEIVLNEGVAALEYYGEETAEYKDIPKLCNLPKKGIKTARRDNHFLTVMPSLKSAFFRSIAEEADCRLYAPLGSIVYADNRFEAIFSEKEFSFKIKNDKK